MIPFSLPLPIPWLRSASDSPLRFPMGQAGDPLLSMLPPRLETIPVHTIVGSVGRHLFLDRNFRPRSRHPYRFLSVRKAMLAGIPLPPIEVYRLHGGYYVIDGHHRVGAAKQIGQLYLEAEVTECREQSETVDDLVDSARIRFHLHTGLRSVVFSTSAGYRQALEQIYEHRWYMCERGSRISLKDAADHWHRTIYLPVIMQIVTKRAERGTLDTQSTAVGDLYLHLSDLKYMVSKERGHDIGFSATVREWAEHRQRSRWAWLRRLAGLFYSDALTTDNRRSLEQG